MRETEARNGAINWRVIGDFWAWVFTGRQLGRRVNMSTIFSERYGVDTDEPEWVQNLRAEYERRIADLQKENDRMIFEENQEIAGMRLAYNHVCEHNRALQAEIVELEAEMDAWRQKAHDLLIEIETLKKGRV